MKIVYESERVAAIRKQLEELDNRELDFLMECIGREKDRRRQEVFQEWLAFLDSSTVRRTAH
ncbi:MULTISPECIES: hypothetical protein [unclassified Carboxydocella]|uniref:hypothetical protein n=1 Tax=unclassified Carboxydocella TaxID=2685367 RepID=UPI0009AE0CB5|nr:MULTISPECIES: hypothetical protein [unclassified Carboxydocella]GAW27826.1 hypothetical protein ULO1_03960 [Carboxydocella sp. ULO1]GAW30265.1 hypothetical protein JDF658_00300 [Carboxydocella sp. JDF658]